MVFVCQLDLNLADKLQTGLEERGFDLSTPPYTLFSGKKKGVSCTLYESGKLVVQGKEMQEFIEFFLEPEILGAFPFTAPEKADRTPRIGGDEAGKGDFFGALCVTALYADESQIEKLEKLGVRDSKSFPDTKILKLAGQIGPLCTHSTLILRPTKYNELYQKFGNLNHMLAWAHATCIADVYEKTGCTNVIVDQFAKEHVLERAITQKKIDIDLVQRTKGESDIVVAAASILARAAFLKSLEKLGRDHGHTLPKGASPAVVRAGRQIVAKEGPAVLSHVAKLHFKTTKNVTGP